MLIVLHAMLFFSQEERMYYLYGMQHRILDVTVLIMLQVGPKERPHNNDRLQSSH